MTCTKKEGEIIVLDKNVLSMHPSKEDLKMMIFLTKPKYYIPIKGGISFVAHEFTDCG